MADRAFKLTSRHGPGCVRPFWQLGGGFEIADKNGSIKDGARRYYTWLIAKCLMCKKAEALVRADVLSHAVAMLEGR